MIATSPESFSSQSTGNPPTASGSLRLVKPGEDPAARLDLARELFRQAWGLMEKSERTPEESDRMVHSAHASRYYWEEVGNLVNWAVAEWLLSRIYTCLGRAEPALYHAKRSEDLAAKAEEGLLCRAYAQEALARAYLLGGSAQPARTALDAADSLAEKLSGQDAFYLQQELKALRNSLPASV